MAPSRAMSMAQARQSIAKQFPESLAPLKPLKDVEVVSTGSMLLDAALGVGGFPFGRLVELFGKEGTGKSTIAMYAAADAQRRYGLPCLYLDYENTFDPDYAKVCGMDTSEEQLIVAQPSDFEAGMGILEFMLAEDMIGSAIVDSTAAMAPKKELEGDVGDTHVAMLARAMSQELRRLVPMLGKKRCVVMFVNQLRELIGGYNPTGVTRTTTPGGAALKFYSSIRIELKNFKSVKGKIDDPISGKQIEGNIAVQIKATVVKSKVGPPFRSGTYYIENGKGLSENRTVLEVAEARNVIQKSGSRISLPFRDRDTGDSITFQGTAQTLAWLEGNPELAAKLQSKILRLVKVNYDVSSSEAISSEGQGAGTEDSGDGSGEQAAEETSTHGENDESSSEGQILEPASRGAAGIASFGSTNDD